MFPQSLISRHFIVMRHIRFQNSIHFAYSLVSSPIVDSQVTNSAFQKDLCLCNNQAWLFWAINESFWLNHKLLGFQLLHDWLWQTLTKRHWICTYLRLILQKKKTELECNAFLLKQIGIVFICKWLPFAHPPTLLATSPNYIGASYFQLWTPQKY